MAISSGSRRACGVVGTLLTAVLVFASSVAAQAYQQKDFDKALKSGKRTAVSRILGGAALQPEIAMFRAYVNNLFAEITRAGNAANAGNLRWAMLDQIRRQTNNADALAEFNRLVLTGANEICTGNFHPVARYNLALLVGDLDQQLASGSSTSPVPPVPLAAAVPVLLGFLSDQKMVDAVKVAALIGLQRHAHFGLAPARQPAVSQAMRALLTEGATPAGRTPEGHLWMRRRAAGVLAAMGTPGNQNEVLSALQSVLTDEDEDIALRCSVADAIGGLQFADGATIDADTLVGQLGDLAVAILAHEVAVAEKELKSQQASAPAMGRGGYSEGYGRGWGEDSFGFTDATEDEGVFPRRRLAARIGCVRRGLAVVIPRAGQQPKTLADNVTKWLDAAQKLIEDKQQDDATLVTEITRLRGDIEGAIRQGQPPAAPATTEPAAEENA